VISVGLNTNGAANATFILAENVKRGTPLLFDYGASAMEITFGPQILFNRSSCHAFYKQGLKNLLPSNYAQRCRNQLEYAAHMSRFLFALNNPIALLDLHFSNIIPINQWKKLINSDNEHIVAWKDSYLDQYRYLNTLINHMAKIDLNLKENAPELVPHLASWMVEHLEKYSLMELTKAAVWIEGALLQGNLSFAEEIAANLQAYDWTTDDSNLYSYKNRRHEMKKLFIYYANKSYLSETADSSTNSKKKALTILIWVKELAQAELKKFQHQPDFANSETQQMLKEIIAEVNTELSKPCFGSY
jgi:hypothetical protein